MKTSMNTQPFTPKELHDRIKRQMQPFPSLLQSAEDERRQALKATADQVAQHGAEESYSEWLLANAKAQMEAERQREDRAFERERSLLDYEDGLREQYEETDL